MQAFHLNPPTAVSEIPATEAWQFGGRQLNSVYPAKLSWPLAKYCEPTRLTPEKSGNRKGTYWQVRETRDYEADSRTLNERNRCGCGEWASCLQQSIA